MLIPKIGCVPAHPANVHRLLYDEEQLVLVFPEGRKGTEKPFHQRYRLRRFGRGGFVSRRDAGAGEARSRSAWSGPRSRRRSSPTSRPLKKLTGLAYFPLTPTFPWLGPLGMLGYLPAKFRIRFLEPIDTAELGADPDSDKALVQTSRRRSGRGSRRACTRWSRERKSVWFG